MFRKWKTTWKFAECVANVWKIPRNFRNRQIIDYSIHFLIHSLAAGLRGDASPRDGGEPHQAHQAPGQGRL